MKENSLFIGLGKNRLDDIADEGFQLQTDGFTVADESDSDSEKSDTEGKVIWIKKTKS